MVYRSYSKNQYLNYKRLNEIADFFNGSLKHIHLLQANKVWYSEYKNSFCKVWFKNFLRPYIVIPYVGIIATAIYFYKENCCTLMMAIIFAVVAVGGTLLMEYLKN